jgi:hypothetical protein
MSDSHQDFEIYKGKTFGSLCKDIVTNSAEKRTQLDILVTDLRGMMKTLADAVTVVPMLKDYLDAGIRNDEQLIKLAAIVQRMIANRAGPDGEGGGAMLLTEEEKKQLMAAVEEAAKSVPEPKTPEKAEDVEEDK